MNDQASRARLQREWVLCAIATAAARFVPLPVLDDVIKSRATRTAVARTWTAHGRPDSPSAIAILADDSRTFWGGVARSAVRAPLRLLFYPIRKLVRIVTAVRGVSADLVGVVLLARSVDRCLTAGWFTSADDHELEAQARVVRRAHLQVIGNADLRVLNRAVGAALRQVGGLRRQAEAFAKRAFGRSGRGERGDFSAGAGAGTQAATPAPTAQEAQVEQGVSQVVAVLDRPEIASILADLDRQFDVALASLTPAGLAPGTRPPASAG